jgi:hypothetical protein
MTQVFLSHSSKDKTSVRRLAYDLRERGIEVWLDEWQINVGDSISQKIEMGIDESGFIAIWLTKSAVQSGWVEREWRAKFSQEVTAGRPIILPLLAEDVPIPVLLRDKLYADFRNDYHRGLEQLLAVPGFGHETINVETDATLCDDCDTQPSNTTLSDLAWVSLADVFALVMGCLLLFFVLSTILSIGNEGIVSAATIDWLVRFIPYAIVVLVVVTIAAIVTVTLRRWKVRKKTPTDA